MFQLCLCIEAPMARNGLEGYSLGEHYFCEYKEKDKNGRPYYQVYPDYGNSGYYETCGTGIFKKFFKIIETVPPIEESDSVIDWLKKMERQCPKMDKIYYEMATKLIQ